MLLELRVENYAVIDNVAVDFASGLNLLTGETGAGKSILIDALALLLGDKASADAVRHGTDKAVISAVFETESKALDAVLEENGLDADEAQLILRREIAAVIDRNRTGPAAESTAMDEEIYGLELPVPLRGPHVEIQTVFAHALGRVENLRGRRVLHAAESERRGLPDASPWLDGLWRFPAQCADRRRRERNALERRDPVCDDARDTAAGHIGFADLRGGRRSDPHESRGTCDD